MVKYESKVANELIVGDWMMVDSLPRRIAEISHMGQMSLVTFVPVYGEVPLKAIAHSAIRTVERGLVDPYWRVVL